MKRAVQLLSYSAIQAQAPCIRLKSSPLHRSTTQQLKADAKVASDPAQRAVHTPEQLKS
jgi:hypothetical protein